jgi:hypothetical protein
MHSSSLIVAGVLALIGLGLYNKSKTFGTVVLVLATVMVAAGVTA